MRSYLFLLNISRIAKANEPCLNLNVYIHITQCKTGEMYSCNPCYSTSGTRLL